MRAAGGKAQAGGRSSPASAACAARTTAQNAALRDRRRLALGRDLRGDRRTGSRAFPALRTAWSRSAAWATCSSSTIPRRPTPTPPPRRWRASPIFSGSPAASRRRRHRQPRRVLPAHPQGLSDRRSGARISPRRWTARCRTRSPARSTARVDARRARCASLGPARSRSCCCRRPAPRSTSSRISRCAARRSPTGAGDSGHLDAATSALMLRKP